MMYDGSCMMYDGSCMFRAMAVDSSVVLLSYSISSGALESPGLLPSLCSIITMSLHKTIILIIPHFSKSTPTSTMKQY